MIYILIKNNLIHSVWNSKREAEYQFKVLKSSGINAEMNIERIEGIIPKNGQYYV